MPALPLRLRNRLAETILSALYEGRARRELARLSTAGGAVDWLEDGEACWGDRLAERAQAAATTLADRPFLPRDADVREALSAATALFEAGLYFEVHELLEPHWVAARGTSRDALQGLIQVAVAWQHLANGNVAGARSLFREGSERLRVGHLAGIDLTPFARAAAEAGEHLAAGQAIRPPRFPSEVPSIKEVS
jgi:Domain of unknown function (DUF309)